MRHLIAMLCLAVATPAFAGPSEDLAGVIADQWRWFLKENPIQATSLGVRDYDTQIGDVSLAAQDRRAKEVAGFLARLDKIDWRALSPAERTNWRVLRHLLAEGVKDASFGQRMMLFSTYYSPHQGYAGMAEGLPFYKAADYRSYLARLALLPQASDDVIAITRTAVKQGFVQPCEAMTGFEDTVLGAVSGAPETTRFYKPFTNARPADMSESEWADAQAKARDLIANAVVPAWRRFADFYRTEYKSKCAKKVGASFLPNGPAYYAHQAKVHTTTDLTPEAIHQIGLGEVKRILARMDETARKAGFPDRAAFVAHLRKDPKYYATSSEQLMAAAALTAKRIDGMMPRYFETLPRLPYGVKQIPAETAETTTTAYYNPGSPPSGIAGYYFVNTSKLDQRPLFELPALTAHEAVPGHHHQIALQQEIPLPDFRRYLAGFTAFVEGWGLYSEYLGEEMGLYDTPEKMMGRLSYEMWRACRLVVDTGMHAKGWTKAQAIAFMKDNTALTDANIEAEVNRYISWPGQALGYKIGEIRIRELRAKAEAALGTKFDLRRFHDAVLMQGAVPLDVLSAQIDEWIGAEKAR